MLHLLAQSDVVGLTSIAGISGLTFLIVEWLQSRFQTNTGFGKIPVVVWRVVIGCGLCLIANNFPSPAHPWLTGNWRELLASVVSTFIGASALRQVLMNPAKPIALTQPVWGPPPVKPDAIKADVAAVNKTIDQANTAAAQKVADAVKDAAAIPSPVVPVVAVPTAETIAQAMTDAAAVPAKPTVPTTTPAEGT